MSLERKFSSRFLEANQCCNPIGREKKEEFSSNRNKHVPVDRYTTFYEVKGLQKKSENIALKRKNIALKADKLLD